MLDKADLTSKNLSQVKNDYESRRIFYGLFLAPKIKYCLTNNECGIIEEHNTFTGFIDSKRFLDGSHNFKMIEDKKNISYVT